MSFASTRGTVVAAALRNSYVLFARFFVGFTDANYTAKTPALPNHLAWTLGHLAMVMHRTAVRVEGGELPVKDFDSGFGSADTIGLEAVGIGSNPLIDASTYPPLARCIAIFNDSIERAAKAYESATDEKLDSTVPWGNSHISLEQLGFRMVFHNGTHCGQIIDLRRSLGLDYVIAPPRQA